MNIEKKESQIGVKEYVEGYVAVEEFLEKCKACPIYGTCWSCPEFDFDPIDYWNRYTDLRIIGYKIHIEDAEKENWEALLHQIKRKLTKELYSMETEFPGSISLSAGTCDLCAPNRCTKTSGAKCRTPEKLRYSIEALGGNVGLTVSNLLGGQLEWIEEGQVPSEFYLIGGLLIP